MLKLKLMEILRKAMDKRFCRLKLFYLWIYNKITPCDKRLRKYKDIHKGKRCFCVGTAPSLTLADIEMLKGEYCFSCNSIIKLYDKTEWRPTYFMVFDPYFYSLFHKEIKSEDYSAIFYNKTQIPSFETNGIAIKGSPEHLIREYMPKKKTEPHLVLSEDLSKKLVIGQSTIHSAMALAAYMGFEEIYLLGVDCDYTIQHAEGTADERLKSSALDAIEMKKDFTDYKPQFEKRGIKVINCSRGNKLNIFPYKELEEVLGKSKNGN